ncbi:MAG TPA: hypothetical protein VNN18_10925 [Candidatus Xenobia bacterium]|nr:hypothetical protein [Candidatus Xenobia bacterium]
MTRTIPTLLILAALLAASFLPVAPALAQDKPAEKAQKPANVYRLDFAIREKENGAIVNTRNYMLLLEDTTGGKGSGKVRAGNRVPIAVGGDKGVQYMDVGLNLDCDLRERDSDISLRIWLEISDFAAPGQEKVGAPLLRTIRTEVLTGIPLGKPTVVSVVDDAATKRRYELEVTATKVK